MRNFGAALATQQSENIQPSVSALPMLVQDYHGWIQHLVALCLDWVVAAISQDLVHPKYWLVQQPPSTAQFSLPEEKSILFSNAKYF